MGKAEEEEDDQNFPVMVRNELRYPLIILVTERLVC